MKRVYRVVWHAAAGTALLLAVPAWAADLPTGGQVVAGSGTITQSGSTMTVTQTSGKLAADWQSFSIGQGHTVNFVQPSASAVALNRVLGSDVSVIQGALTANGQVFLVNPNGVLFTPTAQVNVGALVASTLQLSTDDFLNGTYRFGGNSTAGVKNEGNIQVSNGGTVALMAARIENTGSITAPQGKVLMGAGRTVRLDWGGPVKMEVEEGALNTLIAQGGAIRADGGLVYLSAKAAGDLASSVINHTGITEARTLATGERGEILLMGDMAQGTVHVGGTLDASAPHGGAGGFIETSAHTVKVADGVQMKSGHWLIDPYDFTIAASGGDITGSTLSAALGSNNVTIQTTHTAVSCTSAICGAGNASGNGDIFVNDAVTWSDSTKLTLSAYRNINIKAAITAHSPGGQVQLEYGQGAVAAGNTATYSMVGGKINLQAGDNFFTKLGSDGGLTGWKVITSVGSAGSTTGTDLQGINGGLNSNYVLGADIDASATSSWNGGAGFGPLGSSGGPAFAGRFDGLGHTISNMTIALPATSEVGLFGSIGAAAVVQNVGLIGSDITGDGQVGPLAGVNEGTIIASYATASTYGGTYAGGLVGLNTASGSIQSSYSTGSLRGGNRLGGLVGVNNGAITDSYSLVSISDYARQDLFGGLVGHNDSGTITRSYAAGVVNVDVPTNNAGSLVGDNSGTITDSYWNSDTNSMYGLSGMGAGTTTGATGLSSSQMQDKTNASTYFAGFSFTGAAGSTWGFPAGSGNAPVLCVFGACSFPSNTSVDGSAGVGLAPNTAGVAAMNTALTTALGTLLATAAGPGQPGSQGGKDLLLIRGGINLGEDDGQSTSR